MDALDQASVATAGRRPGRRLRTNDEKRRIVEEAIAPGASLAAVARRHGVNANLLFGWRRLHKQGLLDQCREPASLLPVKVATPTVVPDPAMRPVRKQRAQPATTRRAKITGHVEIELANGTRVRVHGHVEPNALAAVLTALSGR